MVEGNIFFIFIIHYLYIGGFPLFTGRGTLSISSIGTSIEVATFESLPPSYIVNKNEVFKYYIIECTNDE